MNTENIIRNKRKNLGLTQISAAKLCGVSRRTYQTYEENPTFNDTYNAILSKLDELGILDDSNRILNIKYIKHQANIVFKKYPEVEVAYLFGSYARGEANSQSDLDFMLILRKIDMVKYYRIQSDLAEIFNKKVDVLTFKQAISNEPLIRDILIEGIKIYEE